MHVVTFYSFKGGVGRTLALLNVAWELADSGQKVLVVDFDLEAPGIRPDRWEKRTGADFEAGFGSARGARNEGIVEYVTRYLKNDLQVPDVSQYIVDATPDGCAGRLALMPAGVGDGTYGERLGRIDWNDLYAFHDGYVMLEDTRDQWESLGYDYVLVDSRTGYTDVGGICTRHLPDAVVALFRPEGQSLAGMKEIVEAIRAEEPTHRRKGGIVLHFVMAGIPDADDDDGILDARREIFARELGIPEGRATEIRQYQSMDLLTQPVYTRWRQRARLAARYRELAGSIRRHNIEDREGVLMRLRAEGRSGAGVGRRAILDEVRGSGLYDEDIELLCELATGYGRIGEFSSVADLLVRAAGLGPLPAEHWWRSANAHYRLGDRGGAREGLKGFFQSDPSESTGSANAWVPLYAVLRALDWLEDLGEDRSTYVRDSRVLAGLSPAAKVRVAARLDLSVLERREAVRILTGESQEDSAAPDEANRNRELAFAQMATGSFASAAEAFGQARRQATRQADDGAPTALAAAFNHAMARWARDGVPDVAAFREVCELAGDDDSGTQSKNANRLQCLALAQWFVGHAKQAQALLTAAEEAMRDRSHEVSCWSYTRVRRETFLDHCTRMRRLFERDDAIPEFMTTASPSPSCVRSPSGDSP